MDKGTSFVTLLILGLGFWMQAYLVKDHSPELSRLKARFQEKLTEQQQQLQKLNTELKEAQSQLTQEETLTEDEEEELEIIGFSAYYGKRELVLEPDTTVKFFNATFNEGGHYDTSTGRYWCPVTGLYFFTVSVHVLHEPGQKAHLSIVKDDDHYLASLQANVAGSIGDVQKAQKKGEKYDFSKLVYGSGTNSAVTWCEKGSKVEIIAHNHGSLWGGVQRFKFSTFTGFLVSTKY